MRLGQLARKYNLTQEQVIKFLDSHNPGMGPYHNNTKLSDQTEDLIAQYFNKSFAQEVAAQEPEEIVAEVAEKDIVDKKEAIPVIPVEPDEDKIQAELDPDLPVISRTAKVVNDKNEKAISTDKLIELLDSEEENIDLSDITVIRAPKKELEGLKVVGKIDLPEPKPKAESKPADTEQDVQKPRPGRERRKGLSPEEKEKRRLRAKKKKEDYEARQARRQKEAEEKKIKARKKAHYEQKLKKTQASAPKPKASVAKEEVVAELIESPQPKSALGRFWAWFWHGK